MAYVVSMQHWAGPTITYDDWKSGTKSDIDLFEDQLANWLFLQARSLASASGLLGQSAGPSLLALVTPYFEMTACYSRGRKPKPGESTQFLKDGLKIFFPNLSQPPVDAYANEVRHGFAHEAMFRKVILHRYDSPNLEIEPQSQLLAVNPWWLLDQTEIHFKEYIAKLRAGDQAALTGFNGFMKARQA